MSRMKRPVGAMHAQEALDRRANNVAMKRNLCRHCDGLGVDAVDPNYDCLHCQGTGNADWSWMGSTRLPR